MTIAFVERSSDLPVIESITHGHTVTAGSPTRPAEINWHMVFSKREGRMYPLMVGPWRAAGQVTYGAGAELLWIRFRLGVYMPHLTTRKLLDSEITLPDASSQSFWLKGAAWEFPDYENVETFVNRLLRQEILVSDPVVTSALNQPVPDVPSRTLRHRFLHTTGLTQSHIYQFQRAQQAAALLRQGVSILDTVEQAGYYDQPHLTRALRQFIGYTPAQLLRQYQPVESCHSVQDAIS